MNRYYSLSKEERTTLSTPDLEQSIKLEAIERGIKPPIQLSEVLKSMEWVGYRTPADAVTFYAVQATDEYGRSSGARLGFTTKEAAESAIQGAVCIGESGYGDSAKLVIRKEPPSISVIHISFTKPECVAVKLEKFDQDDTEFEKLRDECVEDLRVIRQSDYDDRVSREKWNQYLELAGGDKNIARAFWGKTQAGNPPE